MSVARLLRGTAAIVWRVGVSLLAWILIVPWVALLPRRRNWLAVIGREDGKFADNTKYFLLQGAPLLAPDVRAVLITERNDVAGMLASSAYEVMVYPSPRAVWFLMRCGTLVVDSAEWFRRLRRFLLIRAKKLQLWHGVGFKRTEIDEWRHEAGSSGLLFSPKLLYLRLGLYVLTGRLVRYDAVNTTSAFYRDAVFTQAFFSRRVLVHGYPRNTFGKLTASASQAVWLNVDPSIAQALPRWLEQQRRIVLVAPTFRESNAMPMGLDDDALAKLDDYCHRSGIEFVFKFHPFERNTLSVQGRHIHLCSPDADIYPLMPSSDMLITDYSSIYMDYLLLDKPVMFLVPDMAAYVSTDRQLQFDFSSMTPGQKVDTWDEVISQLEVQFLDDPYANARATTAQLAFDGLDQYQAVPRLINFMRTEGWLPPRRTGTPE